MACPAVAWLAQEPRLCLPAELKTGQGFCTACPQGAWLEGERRQQLRPWTAVLPGQGTCAVCPLDAGRGKARQLQEGWAGAGLGMQEWCRRAVLQAA